MKRFLAMCVLCLLVGSLTACERTDHKAEKTETEITSAQSKAGLETGADSYEGEYNSYDVDEPMLEIKRNEDGTYAIQIGIYRLIQLDDCVGNATEEGIEFSTTEWDGISGGTITFEKDDTDGDIAVVTFLPGWSGFGDVYTYRYYKTSDVPNIYVPDDMN